MTVESQKRRQIVNGTGGVGPYPFTDIPLYDAEDDLAVYIELNDGSLTEKFEVNVDYTLAYSDVTLAGSVTFVSRNVALDEKVVMVRETEITQTIKLSKSGTIDTTNYEDMVDKTTLQNIDQQDELDRSLRVSTAQIGEFNAEIRAVTSADAGRAIVVNDDGDGYDISETNVNDIDDAVADAQASADAAAASASSASVSASSAANSASDAADSAQEAADSASSINLPTPASNTYLRRNAGNTAYETKTVAEVKSDLDIITGVIHVIDQKATGLSGGNSSSGRNTRVLNTVIENTINGASLSSNEVSLPAGNYKVVYCVSQARASNSTRLFLRDTTNSSDLITGNNNRAQGADVFAEVSLGGRFTLSAPTDIALEHYFGSGTTNGLGNQVNDGLPEVYSQLIIEKIG